MQISFKNSESLVTVNNRSGRRNSNILVKTNRSKKSVNGTIKGWLEFSLFRRGTYWKHSKPPNIGSTSPRGLSAAVTQSDVPNSSASASTGLAWYSKQDGSRSVARIRDPEVARRSLRKVSIDPRLTSNITRNRRCITGFRKVSGCRATYGAVLIARGILRHWQPFCVTISGLTVQELTRLGWIARQPCNGALDRKD